MAPLFDKPSRDLLRPQTASSSGKERGKD